MTIGGLTKSANDAASELIIATYGHCIIPKRTLLYRGHSDNNTSDCMFFGTKFFVAESFNDNIQVWQTTTDINVLFLVEYLNSRSWAFSALPRLYANIFNESNSTDYNDLDIKHFDISRRNKLIQKLFCDYKVSGWFTSVEGKIEVEVCLFDKQENVKHLTLLDICNREDKKYFRDSLQRIKIFPPNFFYEQTTTELKRNLSSFVAQNDFYKQHQKFTNSAIKEYINHGMTRLEAKHYMYDLRTKLKI